jgi:hypothetical protein
VANDRRTAIEATERPENPAYLALVAQIEGAQREINHLVALREDLRNQQRTYDARLLQIPEVEREYQNLTRDYQNAQARYREIKAKQLQAEGSQELEKDRRAERFSVGEPANLPERPLSPNRPLIAFLGVIAGLIGGLSVAGLIEAFDPSVKGPLELARLATVPILMAIPYIETHRERFRKRLRLWIVLGFACLMGAAVLLGIHHFLRPLPALLDSVVNRIPLW